MVNRVHANVNESTSIPHPLSDTERSVLEDLEWTSMEVLKLHISRIGFLRDFVVGGRGGTAATTLAVWYVMFDPYQ